MGNNYTVYMHESPSAKKYIGITSLPPSKRWEGGKGYQHNEYFSRAIKKYGWENFKHIILFDKLSKEEAEVIERELIKQYKTNDHEFGYNLTDGGEVGKKHSQDSIKKMSLAKKGKYLGENNPHYGISHSPETRKKISEKLKGMFAGEKNINYGKHMTEEQKNKISAARSGKHYPKLSEAIKNSKKLNEIRNKRRMAIDQYTIAGEYVRTWECAPLASIELLGHSKGQANICSCANGRLRTAYGYKWKYHMEGGDCSQ